VTRVPAPAGTAPAESRTTPRLRVALPRGVTVTDTGRGLEITRRWFHPAAILLAFFAATWIGFLAFWYGMAGSSGAPTFFFLFPLVHVAVGLALGYGAAAMFLNRTVIRAEGGSLSVRHGPLPWRQGPTIPSSGIAQVFTREDRPKQDSGSPTYSVHAVRRDGTRVRLLGTVPSADHALFLEQAVERHLKIADRSVPGEVPRE
jgi:hypothetical protein